MRVGAFADRALTLHYLGRPFVLVVAVRSSRPIIPVTAPSRRRGPSNYNSAVRGPATRQKTKRRREEQFNEDKVERSQPSAGGGAGGARADSAEHRFMNVDTRKWGSVKKIPRANSNIISFRFP
ncbi:hypothetical protein EVAR_673_1 [Eumeta japonica]|uniref:Uncharacterized protein n=1 Tax=Eumeta variegata TaxID=151549 RepID=A0A4C1SBL8_EUMVA|nr:hypothetical protein EVAR_673_1 [Eumeta japonica]